MTLLHSVGEFHKKNCSILSSGMVDVISSTAGSQPLRQYITKGLRTRLYQLCIIVLQFTTLFGSG